MTYTLSVESVSTYRHGPEKGLAVDAARERYNRIRAAGVKAEHLYGVTSAQITYTDPMTGDHHTLTYEETSTE